MELNIYKKDGSLKLTVSPSDSSTVTEEVGGECSVSLSFDTFEFRPIEVNDYIEVAGVRYKARMAYRPKMKNRQSYSYSLRFYAPIHDAEQVLMKTETDGGLIPEFSLWGGPREHLQKWVDNMNRLAGSDLWTIGSVITGENKNIDYQNVNCWDAAFGSNGIAATYETEMWADGYVINLCKCERGERVTLGYGNGLTGLTPEDNSDKVRFFTRLYPLGSTKNIDVSTYGFSRLQLPSRATFVDHNTDRYGVFEDSEEAAFADIFPQYIGTVTAVRSEPKTDENGKQFTVYYIKDSGMTWEPQALPEKTFMLSFQTGDLQGYGDDTDKSFQAEWHKDTKEWEIINIWLDENTQVPGGNIVPITGNQYFPWNMIMPQEYITEAEKRYEAAVNDFVANYSGEPVAYSGSTDYIHCAKQAVPLRIGQNVRLESDLYFEDGYQNTRITKVVRKLCRLTDATVTFAEQIGTGWKKSVDNQLSSLHYEMQRQAEQAGIDVIKTTDAKTPSDNNVFSALRSLAMFLRKDKADSTSHLLTLLAGAIFGENKASIGADGAAQFLSAVFNGGKASISSDGAAKLLSAIFNGGKASIASDGAAVLLSAIFNGGKAKVDSDGAAKFLSILLGTGIETENFSTGALGAGFCLKKDENGDTYLEVDRMLVRKVATFIELLIQRLRYVGGQIILTPASMSCIKVEDKGTYYRCYFSNTDGTKTIKQEFVVGDQARSQTFNIKEGVSQNVSNTYYWRLVVGVGDDYIDLSKADCDAGSTVPASGDDIVQLGNRTETDRQAAIVLAAYGNDAPYIKMYRGINSYVLDGKEFVTISRTKVNITADSLKFATGENVKDEINKVVTSANEAVISANNAIASANEANQKAEEAKNRLDSWAADGVISPTEKQSLKDEIVRIDADKTQIENGYAKYGLGSVPMFYTVWYSGYRELLTNLTQDTPETIEIPAVFQSAQTNYYNQRTLALTAISNAAKDAIDDVESDFNGKIDKVNSSITQTKDEITLEVNSVKSDLATFKEETNTQFSVQDGKITSAVTESKEYADSAIGNIQVGNRNILRNSGEKVVPKDTDYLIREYKSTIQFVAGAKYTIVIKGSTSTGQKFGLWVNGAQINVGYFSEYMKGEVAYKQITMPYNIGTPSVSTLRVYNYPDPNGVSKPCEIEWIAMYEGHIKPPMDWTPAPEDSIDQMLQGSVGNYILNSAFDNGTSNWVAQDSLVISVDTETHHQVGVNTLKVVQSAAANTALTGTRVYQEATKLNPASLSFWVKASKETQFKVRLGGDESYTKTVSVNTEWQRVKIEDATPSTNAVVFGALSACTWWLSEPILTNTTTAYNWQPSNGDVVRRIEVNSSKIEQLPDQITLQVKKDITTGGLNYIANTQGEVVAEGQNKENQIITGGWKIHPSIAGKKYGAAFKIKFEGCTFRGSSFVYLQVYNNGGWNYNALTLETYGLENKEYVIYRNTNTAPSSLTGYGSVQIRVDYVSGGKITISEIRAYDVPEGLVGAFPWYPSKWDTEVLSSEIKQTADSITSTVKKEIGDITIGGDNCISNSDFSSGTSGWSYSSVTISAQDYSTHVLGINILRVVQASASDSNLDSIRIFQYAGISVGDTVSFSCWVHASVATKIKIRLCGGSENMKEFSVGTKWTYITFENVTASSTALIMGATSACTWYLSEPMLVQANKATSWAKKLSEQRNEISTIKQTSNSISLKVDQIGDGLSATGIDITNKKIDITADKLSIKTNSGKSVAVFDGSGDVPKLNTGSIIIENVGVVTEDYSKVGAYINAKSGESAFYNNNSYVNINPYSTYLSITSPKHRSEDVGPNGERSCWISNGDIQMKRPDAEASLGVFTAKFIRCGSSRADYVGNEYNNGKSMAIGCNGFEIKDGATYYKGVTQTITINNTKYFFKDGILVGVNGDMGDTRTSLYPIDLGFNN